MKFTAALHSLFFTVGFATASLRGDGNIVNGSRRHLEPGMECVTYLRVLMNDDKTRVNDWMCEFSDEDASQLGAGRMVMIDGLTKEDIHKRHAISGGTVLKVGSSSFVEKRRGKGGVLHVAPDDNFVIEEMDEHIDVRHYKNRKMRRGRRLAETTGTFNTLVIRAIDDDGAEPPNAQQLEQDIFLDTVNLKSTYDKCSHGMINIQQAQNEGFSASYGGDDFQGIIDVQVDYTVDDEDEEMWEDAEAIAAADYNGGDDLEDDFDLVMICLPAGVDDDDWIAWAYVNHHISVYNNDWCGYVSVQMHEVGHNLGLAHSGEDGDEYGDTSGAMGYGFSNDDTPEVCFNAPQSYQLGWYPGATLSIDPLSLQGVQTYILNGVVDYGDSDGYVSIRLEYTGEDRDGKDFFLGYNRATDFNVGTSDGPDMVHITEKINEGYGRDEYGQSWLLAKLSAEGSYTLDLDGTDVTIEVQSIVGKDATITISNGSAPNPDPTSAPIPSPTSAPNPDPTSAPNPDPTSAPIPSPTLAPNPDPTSAPIPSPTLAPNPDPTLAPIPSGEPTAKPTKAGKSGKSPKRKLRY